MYVDDALKACMSNIRKARGQCDGVMDALESWTRWVTCDGVMDALGDV